MRSYGQYCALAKALDVVGDRWTLLIVRELMARGRARYTDVRDGLPGIASNLLSERLRNLEAAGIITREDAPAPVATTLYGLTPRGEALRPILRELGRWGSPLLASSDKHDEIRGHWLAMPAELYLTDAEPRKPPISIEVHMGDEPVTLTTTNGAIKTQIGTVAKPDAVIGGPPREVAAVLLRGAPLAAARKRGVRFTGDATVLKRLKSTR